ncbi:MAG: DNA polymerase III subunit beta [Planctomycetes bacterium]|nr:DNA polymerase III subunit beta [Planctomycetota bacterium]MCB9870262.1 DNA polymerase III subunit beta [Planctomycetota bacterium]MCB9888158.1 DNA polymerase III subunit beta [Planctomycetota bacterium]
MKILCDRHQLSDALSFVAGLVPLKTTKPILQNVLLEATGDSLTLSATDNEISGSVVLETVKVHQPGSMLLPAKQITALVRELSEPTVTMRSTELRCTIESGGGSFVLVGDEPERFPRPASPEHGHSIRLPAARLLDMVRKTMFAAAKEESRYTINGVLFDCREACLRVVATDGRRLALTYENLDGHGGQVPEFKAVIPIRTLQLLGKAIHDDSQAEVTVTFTENQVAFRFETSLLVSQLLECNFPDYEVVIPKAADTTCEISRDLLERNVRKVAILSSGDMRLVQMNFGSQTLEMSAESTGVGRAEQVMDVDVRGAGGSLSFNPDFVLEALKVCDLEQLRLDMGDDSTPVKMTLGESFTYILMPISGS